MSAQEIVIAEYDPTWPVLFRDIEARVRQALPPAILSAIEHVGSTAVPDLAAKPIVDMIVVISTGADRTQAIISLAELGYVHEGDLGITGRDAFRWPPGSLPHHLYVCDQDSQSLRDQTLFRDYLRTHSDAAQEYEALKRDLAIRLRHDRRAYADGKTEYVQSVLEKAHRESSVWNE